MNKNIFGIITESEQIASSQRAIFEHVLDFNVAPHHTFAFIGKEKLSYLLI